MKLYFKELKKHFHYFGKEERRFIKELKRQIKVEMGEFVPFDDILNLFGQPKDIVSAYYDEINFNHQPKRTYKFKKHIQYFFIISISIGLLIFVSEMIRHRKTYIERETIIIEEINIESEE